MSEPGEPGNIDGERGHQQSTIEPATALGLEPAPERPEEHRLGRQKDDGGGVKERRVPAKAGRAQHDRDADGRNEEAPELGKRDAKNPSQKARRFHEQPEAKRPRERAGDRLYHPWQPGAVKAAGESGDQYRRDDEARRGGLPETRGELIAVGGSHRCHRASPGAEARRCPRRAYPRPPRPCEERSMEARAPRLSAQRWARHPRSRPRI